MIEAFQELMRLRVISLFDIQHLCKLKRLFTQCAYEKTHCYRNKIEMMKYGGRIAARYRTENTVALVGSTLHSCELRLVLPKLFAVQSESDYAHKNGHVCGWRMSNDNLYCRTTEPFTVNFEVKMNEKQFQ